MSIGVKIYRSIVPRTTKAAINRELRAMKGAKDRTNGRAWNGRPGSD